MEPDVAGHQNSFPGRRFLQQRVLEGRQGHVHPEKGQLGGRGVRHTRERSGTVRILLGFQYCQFLFIVKIENFKSGFSFKNLCFMFSKLFFRLDLLFIV